MIKENEKQTYVTGITPNVNYHDIQKIPTTPLHTRILDNLYIYIITLHILLKPTTVY